MINQRELHMIKFNYKFKLDLGKITMYSDNAENEETVSALKIAYLSSRLQSKLCIFLCSVFSGFKTIGKANIRNFYHQVINLQN